MKYRMGEHNASSIQTNGDSALQHWVDILNLIFCFNNVYPILTY